MSTESKQQWVDRFGALATKRLDRRSFVRLSVVGASAMVSVPLLAACGGDDAAETPAAPTAASDATQPPATEPTSDATAAATEVPTAPSPTSATTATSEPAATAASATSAAGSGQIDGGDPMMGKEMDAPDGPGGTLIEGSILDLRSLHPVLFNNGPSYAVGGMVFDTLTQAHIETMEPVGRLAAGWESSDDATTWTLFLQENVKWHDGEDFTADDVKFTYDTLMDPSSGSSHTSDLQGKIEALEVVDPHTITFQLKAPLVDFLIDVAGVYYLMFAKHIWADVPPADIQSHGGSTGQDPDMVVGTGPFLFKEWITGDHVTLLPNPDYWGGEVYLEQFIYKIVPDTSAAVAQLKTGELDLFLTIPGSEVVGFEGTDIVVSDFDTLSFNFYGTQLDETKSTKFQDVRVRKAMLHALDRQAIIDTIQFGYSSLAIGTMPKLSWAYNPEGIDPANHYEYDVDKANALLDEAGWTRRSDGIRELDGQRLAFDMQCISSSESAVQVLQAYQEYWREIGIEMTPSPEPFPNLLSRITETFDFEVFTVAFGWGPTPDQSTMWKCDSFGTGFNFVKYCNPQVDELLDAAMAELDRDKRIQLYTDFQNTLLTDLPMAVTDFPRANTGVSKKVHNFFANSQNARFNCDKWWVES